MPSANARWYKIGEALLVLSQGDITQWSGDALVNAGWQAVDHTPVKASLRVQHMQYLVLSTSSVCLQQMSVCWVEVVSMEVGRNQQANVHAEQPCIQQQQIGVDVDHPGHCNHQEETNSQLAMASAPCASVLFLLCA